MCGLQNASYKKHVPVEELFTDDDKTDILLFVAKCVEIIDPRVRKAVSHYGHTPVIYATTDGTQHYPGTDALWADKGNAMYDWICTRRGYFDHMTLNAESKGDLLEVCFNLYYMYTVLDIDLTQVFKFDSSYMTTWCVQWAMLLRDIHVSSMSGIADISIKHPNDPALKKPARLETVCKYYNMITKLEVTETIQALEGKRTHEPWVTVPSGCIYCGNPISKDTKHWVTIYGATSAIWTHLETCDQTTH